MSATVSDGTTSPISRDISRRISLCFEAENQALLDSDDDSSSAEGAVWESEHLEARAAEIRKGEKVTTGTVGRRGSTSSFGACEEYLLSHNLRDREMDAATKELLMSALKKNRFCMSVSTKGLQSIVDQMEYFEFGEGDVVMTQGEPGQYFFVASEGLFDVLVNDVLVRQESRSGSFGGIALLYNTARSATIIANKASGAWGVRREIFRNALRANAREHYAENRQLLDRIGMFDGLTASQMERLSRLGLFEEGFDAEHVLMRRGEMPHAIYIVKSGKLRFLSEGKVIAEFIEGDCFGWRALLFGHIVGDVIVTETCRVVGVAVSGLRKALGEDLANHLLHSYVFSVLKKTVISQLPTALLQKISEATVLQTCQPGDQIKMGFMLAIVIDGEASSASPYMVQSKRGQFRYGTELLALQKQVSPEDTAAMNYADDMLAGPSGCRLATITLGDVGDAMAELFGPPKDGKVVQLLMQILLALKVPVFRNLSHEQLNQLASTMQAVEFSRGATIFESGQHGDALYFVREGRVSLSLDGNTMRAVTTGQCFGARSLILDEPRLMSAKVMDGPVKLWSITRESLKATVPEGMRYELAQSMQLHGTNVSMKSLKHVRFIGAGSFGTVRQVEHKSTGFRYALKRIKKKNGEVPPEVTRECKLLAENCHPFLLQYVDKFETTKSIYVLTELITGGQLGTQVLDRTGVLPRNQAQFYVGSLCLTLQCLHDRSIVHRDVKPENIMLDGSGYLKLVDFGLARKLDASLPRAYTIAGTVHYMAPEVLEGQGYGYACDVWSLGCVLFEFVCGALPFGNDAQEVAAVASCIIDDPLQFPSRYNDSAGKKLIQAVLNKDQDSRLGNGSKGWEEIKSHKYFKQGVSGNLFSKITGREIDAPFEPHADEFPDAEQVGGISQSDSEELGKDDPLDFGCRLLAIFRKFDLNGDGMIDRDELVFVLGKLDAAVFTTDVCDEIFGQLEEAPAGGISYDSFVSWILNEEVSGDLKQALVVAAKLEVGS